MVVALEKFEFLLLSQVTIRIIALLLSFEHTLCEIFWGNFNFNFGEYAFHFALKATTFFKNFAEFKLLIKFSRLRQ